MLLDELETGPLGDVRVFRTRVNRSGNCDGRWIDALDLTICDRSHTYIFMHLPNPPELILLKALWQQGEMRVRALHDTCSDQLGWSFSSTRKTLERMVDKGFVEYLTGGGPARYRARVSKTPTLAHLIRDMYKRVLEIDGPVDIDVFAACPILEDEELDELAGLLG